MMEIGSGLGSRRRRGRRQHSWLVLRFLLGVAGVALVGGYGYQVGVSANQAWTATLEGDVERMREDNLALRDQLAEASLRASHAQSALESLRERYRAEVPDGDLAALIQQVGRQLAAGVDRDRLALLIDAAGRAPDCAAEPVTRRFRPHTQLASGPVGAVRFGDRITVTATGASAADASGQLEAWFDPAKPVRIAFRALDGRTLDVEGILPLRHSMLVDGQEYRFSAIAGPTSFVEVTGQVCPLP
jgi:hypothetical protein